MRLAAAVARALGRRGGIVVGLCALTALSVGVGAVIAGGSSLGVRLHADAPVPRAPVTLHPRGSARSVTVGHSYKNDVSRPLRSLRPKPFVPRPEHEASPNPRPVSLHRNGADPVRQTSAPAPNMPGKSLDFDGIGFPGVACNCAPPDPNGEVGASQYVQSVNVGFQIFSKTTGTSVYGPADIATLWSGFGGVCETAGDGDPVLLYDQLADRWVISQFAGDPVPTDECVAVSTSSDATGSWNRYAFHLGSNFFDYPHLGVWPDGYYLSMNVFNSAGTTYLGPQPFVLDRAAMLAGNPATFQTPGITGGGNEETYLPADLDGSTAPPAGAPNPFVEYPSGTPAVYKVYRFHVDWATPANTAFTAVASPPGAAAFTSLCPTARACVPQSGVTTSSYLDGIGDRFMFRNAYRNFGGHESLLANYTVSSGGVAGIRWVELRNLTSGTPTVFQQSTYQPDSTWRWLASAAMDGDGDMALGFSASSAAMNPQIRYAGRLAGDPLNTLAQGEAHLFNGAGSQRGSDNRWGDYSDLTVDPVDDCTFWYTNEYYSSTGTFNWRTRIGSFRFPSCSPSAGAHLAIAKTADAASIASGSQIGFTVTLTNSGTDPATGVALTDALPSGTGIDWRVDTANSDAGWSISGSPPNESLVAPATVAGGNETHVHVVSVTTAGSCGTYANTASFTDDNGGSGSASASTTVTCAPTCGLSQGFDNVGSLPGWVVRNNSSPLGSTGWFQGDPAAFAAQAGADNSFIAADFRNTGANGTISDWLLTPTLTLQNGAKVVFWTRKIDESAPFFYPDRLQVRLSTNGTSTNVGTTPTSVGDFTRLLLDLNPTYAGTGYPFDWAAYTLTLSGLSGSTSGRVAFRYFVEDGGSNGTNSDYIGLDSACLPAPAPSPATPPPPPPPPPLPPPKTLSVTTAGSGVGTVRSSPDGISCGAMCWATFADGTAVTLTAAPRSGSRFVSWSGACSGTAKTCQVTMTADRSATATFAPVRCTVPRAVGLKLKRARARLVRAHCRLGRIAKRASSRRKKGRVLAQSPRPGKRLKSGSRVNLVVGKGPRAS